MIKINLISQRRAKRTDRAQQDLMVGLFSVGALIAILFFFVHGPATEEVTKAKRQYKKLKKENSDRKRQLRDFKNLQTAVKNLNTRLKAIRELESARSSPAHLLHELSRIMTPRRMPTMHDLMAETMASNPNRELSKSWDPKHVWIQSFEEKKGKFKLQGGAQSDGDMTQLAKRMQASVYFENVVPEGGSEKTDKKNGVSYYKFTISGKVVY